MVTAENRGPEPRTSSPILNCRCDWVMRDTGTMGNPQRVTTHPFCKVHGNPEREGTSDSRGSEPTEP